MNAFSNVIIEMANNNFLNSEVLASIEDLETFTTHMVRSILQEWLESSEEPHPNPQTHCRECGHLTNYVSKRIGFIQSKFGLLRYRRAYYVCPGCHQSTCPLDERLNPVESLARLRRKLAEGKQMAVAEIAKDWGLGSIKINPLSKSSSLQSTTEKAFGKAQYTPMSALKEKRVTMLIPG